MKLLFKNFGYTFTSNLVSTIISTIIVLVLPKVMGTDQYGYVQLYMLYSGYVAFLHLGIVDGVYLRFGGHYYEDLNPTSFSRQFQIFNFIQTAFALIILVIGTTLNADYDKKVLAVCLAVSVILNNNKSFVQYIFQSTGRIKMYSLMIIIEKVCYLMLVLCGLFMGARQFYIVAVFDLLARLASLSYGLYYGRSVLMKKVLPDMEALKETLINMRCGLNLTISYLVGISIVSIVRLNIENVWSIETFAKVSLSLSVSNMLLMFIRAVAVVMFPMLRRTSSDKLAGIYRTMRTCLMLPLLGMLVFYYPAKVILSAWLPQYADSLVYMALLFPMCVFESKMSMLIETYMKTLRKEKWLLMVNVATVSLSVVLTLVTTYWLHNLDLAVASIVVLLAFRCVFAELLLSRVLQIHVIQDIALELTLTIIFITASWFVGGVAGLAVYAVAYVVYLVIKRKDVQFAFNTVKRLVGRK